MIVSRHSETTSPKENPSRHRGQATAPARPPTEKSRVQRQQARPGGGRLRSRDLGLEEALSLNVAERALMP